MKKLARFLLMMAGLAALPACASSDGVMAGGALAAAPTPQVEQQQAAAPEPVRAVSIKHAVSVYFDSGGDEIRAGAMQTLYGASVDLKGSRILAVRITGYTDASGKRSYNQRLSERRAAAVADQLAKLGVRAEVLVVRGAGEASAQGKHKSRQDRRVDVEFETVVEQTASLVPQADSITAATPAFHPAATLAKRGDTALPGPSVTIPTADAASPLALRRGDKHAIKLTFLSVGATWLPPPVV